jgi:hypothetical protein
MLGAETPFFRNGEEAPLLFFRLLWWTGVTGTSQVRNATRVRRTQSAGFACWVRRVFHAGSPAGSCGHRRRSGSVRSGDGGRECRDTLLLDNFGHLVIHPRLSSACLPDYRRVNQHQAFYALRSVLSHSAEDRTSACLGNTFSVRTRCTSSSRSAHRSDKTVRM